MDKHLNVLEIVHLIMFLLEKNGCSYSETKAVLDIIRGQVDDLAERQELPYTEAAEELFKMKKSRENPYYEECRKAIENIIR